MWAKRYVPDELLLVFNDDDMFVDRPRAEALLDDTDDIDLVDADVRRSASCSPTFQQ